MAVRPLAVLLFALAVAGCSLPPPDQPAAPNRVGRFIGLIGNCGCSDIGPDRIVAEYPRAMAGRYSDADIKAMHGYVDVGASERYDNQILICREACAQTCMVNTVVLPLGGRPAGDGRACPITERDLHLTEGLHDNIARGWGVINWPRQLLPHQ